MKVHGLYSAGGFAREVRSSLVASLELGGSHDCEVVFIDDDPSVIGTVVHGSRVLSYKEFAALPDRCLNVAFADPALRKRKVDRATEDRIEFYSLCAPSAILDENATVGKGAILAPFTVVHADAVVGDHFHANIYSYVAHDCVIGDFVTFAPRVSLNGRVVVEDMVYVGSDATILPGTPDKPLVLGEGAVIGAGALVTKSVERGTTVVGSPAKPLQR